MKLLVLIGVNTSNFKPFSFGEGFGMRLFEPDFLNANSLGINKIKHFVEEITQILSTKHDLEKKKSRKNQEEIYDITYCITVD